MASIRATAARISRPSWSTVAVAVTRRMEGGVGGSRAAPPRYFSDRIRTGRVLSEEERAAENVYIQKMEREKLEKLRRKADQEKADAAKKKAADAAKRAAAAEGDKKGEGRHPS